MHYINELERLHQLHGLIKNENSGTPKQIARKMQISERSIYRLIEKLKDLNAEVCFDRKRNTYYYLSPFELQFSITVKAISNNDIVNLYGGCFFQKKYFTANIWQ